MEFILRCYNCYKVCYINKEDDIMENKTDLVRRAFAFIIDMAIMYLVGLIPIIGAIIGFAYMLLKDGLLDGQSVGKKLLDLKVVTDHGVATYRDSVRRNLIFAIPSLFMLIPFVGQLVTGILEVIICVAEMVKVLNDPEGKRYGDIWAGTKVMEVSR